ncbi:hypothetical protein [Streptomyces sp. NBC_00342]|uniref:hypothetical protein n=1 Tax=Streptomyces sp. NBC_00342 TaxID=2975718 RepID=UPI00325439AA
MSTDRDSISASIQCRSSPSITAATWEDEQDFGWEQMQTFFRSTCQWIITPFAAVAGAVLGHEV